MIKVFLLYLFIFFAASNKISEIISKLSIEGNKRFLRQQLKCMVIYVLEKIIQKVI